MAWARVGDGAVSPGDAQRHGREAWVGVVWSGTGGALRGRGGVFDGGRWLCGTGDKRGCLAVSWVGGDRVCTRQGRRAVCGLRSSVALWRMLGMVDSGTGMAFLAVLVAVCEAGLVERGR